MASVVLNIVAVVLSLASLTISAVLANRQYLAMQRTNQLPVFVELTQEFRSDDFQVAEGYVLLRLHEEQPISMGISGLPDEARIAATRMLTFYSTFGALMVFRMASEAIIVGMFGFRANRTWIALEPYIEREREIRGDPEYVTMFEHVVARTRQMWPPPARYGFTFQRLADTAADPLLSTGRHPLKSIPKTTKVSSDAGDGLSMARKEDGAGGE